MASLKSAITLLLQLEAIFSLLKDFVLFVNGSGGNIAILEFCRLKIPGSGVILVGMGAEGEVGVASRLAHAQCCVYKLTPGLTNQQFI